MSRLTETEYRLIQTLVDEAKAALEMIESKTNYWFYQLDNAIMTVEKYFELNGDGDNT